MKQIIDFVESNRESAIDLLKRLAYSFVLVIIGATFCWFNLDFIVDKIILGPTHNAPVPIIFTEPSMYGQIALAVKIGMWGGVIIAFPFIVWNLWCFIKPAIDELASQYNIVKTIKYNIFKLICYSLLLFIGGILFGYFVLTPMMIDMVEWKITEKVNISIALSNYIDNLLVNTIGSGLVLQFPLVMIILSFFNVVSVRRWIKISPYLFLGFFIVISIVSPGDTVYSNVVFSILSILLYFITIGYIWVKKRTT